MTPKEKADDLYHKFLTCQPEAWMAKQIALIAIDEVIEILTFDLGHDPTARMLCEYLEEVKQEINML